MPYDGKVADYTTPVNAEAETLRRAKALIDAPEKWLKHEQNNAAMTAFCFHGALSMAISGAPYVQHDNEPAYLLFCRANPEGFQCRYPGLTVRDHVNWNNAPERTHAEVMAAFDRAIALAESEGR